MADTKVYPRRIIPSDECDNFDEALILIQKNFDRTCELSEQLEEIRTAKKKTGK